MKPARLPHKYKGVKLTDLLLTADRMKGLLHRVNERFLAKPSAKSLQMIFRQKQRWKCAEEALNAALDLLPIEAILNNLKRK